MPHRTLLLFASFMMVSLCTHAQYGEEGGERAGGWSQPEMPQGAEDVVVPIQERGMGSEDAPIAVELLNAPGLDEVLKDDFDQRLASLNVEGQGMSATGTKELLVYDCKYVQAATLRRVLEDFITAEGRVSESRESDQLIVSDLGENLALIESIIGRLDQPVPQILVEARIVELNSDSDLEKEIDLFYQTEGMRLGPEATLEPYVDSISSRLSVGGATPTTGQGAILDTQVWDQGTESLNLFFRYLETNGKAKILSAPNLIIQRGKEGSILTGEEVPILSQTTVNGGVTTSTEFKSVGIKLNVKPTMISGQRVRVEVSPEVSAVTGFSEAGEISNPIIAVRQARTELEVRDGQLISMAGLLQSTDRLIERRTPILASIPFVGALFRSERTQTVQTQLIIFLNIRILEFGDETIHRPDNIDPRITEEIERMEQSNQERIPEPNLIRDVQNFF